MAPAPSTATITALRPPRDVGSTAALPEPSAATSSLSDGDADGESLGDRVLVRLAEALRVSDRVGDVVRLSDTLPVADSEAFFDRDGVTDEDDDGVGVGDDVADGGSGVYTPGASDRPLSTV
jgi:hypothetical protein